MTTYLTRDDGCKATIYGGGKRPDECPHGFRFQTEAELRPPERTPLRRVSEKHQAEIDSGQRPRTGSTLKAGRGFAVANLQREKVKLLVCVGCGREVDPDDSGRQWTIDPAHLVPRSAGGCDDVLCVVPLCRHLYIPETGCHWAYDHDELDLHPRLARGGYEKELAHAIEAHGLTPLELVRRVTGQEYVPASDQQTNGAESSYERSTVR